MPFGDNPRAGKVNPHNGAVVPADEDLFDSQDEFELLMADYGVDEDGARFLRASGLI